MSKRVLAALACLALVTGAAWLGSRGEDSKDDGWQRVSPGVYRSPGLPAVLGTSPPVHAISVSLM